jgi:GcrA cell cycle regulator
MCPFRLRRFFDLTMGQVWNRWRPGAVELLHELWLEKDLAGLPRWTDDQIAQRIGFPVRAIINKVNREKLPSRLSMIAAATNGTDEADSGARKVPPLPVLPSLQGRPVNLSFPPMTMRPPSTCAYPYGEVGTPRFRFCGARTQEGSSYCSDHHRLCWHVPGRRQDAA